MKKLSFISVFLIALALVLGGCGGEESTNDEQVLKRPKKSRTKDKKVKKAAVDYSFKTTERNPFRSHLARRKIEPLPGIEKGPLECCDLSAIRLKVVITSVDEPKGFVLTPDGEKFEVGIGDKIGNKEGVIVDMTSRGLIVEEVIRDIEFKIIDRVRVELNLLERN